MAKLKKRADGRYRRVVNGKAFYGTSEREINRKILEYQEKRENGRSFAEVADEWWREAYDTLEYQTVKVYRPALNRALDYFGTDSIKSILPRDVSAFLRIMVKQGYAQKTISNQRVVLSQIFNTAIIENEIMYNPCASVVLPKNLPKSERTAASSEDEEKILNSKSEWLFPLFALLSGLRKGEILALQWKDIDFESNTISVTKSVEHVGNRPNIKAPKTAAGTRLVPLLDTLKERIAGKQTAPDDFIISDDGKFPLTNRRFITLYDRYKAENGISCTAHQLRHSYATVAIEQEVQPRELQGVLGHASAKMTLEKYAHYREKAISNVAEKLNKRYKNTHK